ncbi:g13332 [Coccomyxa viridis]|uniref:G13332 protein n=1 Tax=Coccomyxa viridis TaxID=1274662 RepID=A0ABP1GCH8_9CHLO
MADGGVLEVRDGTRVTPLMGILCSCCKGGNDEHEEGRRDRPLHTQPPTEQDLEARRQAADAAAARQAKFESSAGGRAAKKAMDNVKKEREADAAARNDTAKEWLS